MDSITSPLVGVIVPCFNQGEYAVDCIHSLYDQSYQNWKGVLINDASTDGISGALCKQLASEKVKVVDLQVNLGRALVRNEGVKQLGEVDYILNVDCDDKLSSRYIENLVNAMESDPKAGLAYGLLHYFGKIRKGDEGKVWPDKPFTRNRMYLENVIPGPGAMIRVAALRQTDGWHAEFTRCSAEDYDIWLQVVEAGWNPVWVREAAYHYRQHAQSFLASTNSDIRIEVELKILWLHAKQIHQSGNMKNYLNKLLFSELVGAISNGNIEKIGTIARVLIKVCPLVLSEILIKYYSGRAVACLRANLL